MSTRQSGPGPAPNARVANAPAAVVSGRSSLHWIRYRGQRFWQRRRRVGWATSILLIVVLSGITFAAAGAQRTLSMSERYERRYGGSVDATVAQSTGAPRTAELERLASVNAVHSITFAFGALVRPDGDFANAIVFYGASDTFEAFGSRIVRGRSPRAVDEFAVSVDFLETNDARIGDRFRLVTLTQAQGDTSGFDTPPDEIAGPTLDATIVGAFAGPADLNEGGVSLALFPPSLADLGDVGISASQHAVGLVDGAGAAKLRSELDRLPDADEFGIDPVEIVPPHVRSSVAARGQGIAIVTGVLAGAALIVIGQVLSRQVRLDDEERLTLRNLGATRRQLVADPTARAVATVLPAVVPAGLIAYLASGRFPLGFTDVVEPSPGVRLESVHVWAPLLWSLLILGWVAVSMTGFGRDRVPRTVPLAERVARSAADARQSTALRFAFSRSGAKGVGGSVAVPLIGLAAVTAAVVASMIFGSTIDRLLAESWRYGAFDAVVGQGGQQLDAPTMEKLSSDERVQSLIQATSVVGSVDSKAIDILGFEVVRGGFDPIMFDGRPPSSGDEVMLGRLTARNHDLEVGDLVSIRSAGGDINLTVSGIGVISGAGGGDGVGEGGMVTAAGSERLDPDAGFSSALVDVRPGASIAAMEADLDGVAFTPPDAPASISTLGHIAGLPAAIAAVLAVLALLGIGHHLVTSVRHRNRDFGVIRSLGADRKWVATVVRWQTLLWASAVVIAAVPLGVIFGRVIARAFLDRTGALSDPAVPVWALALGSVILIALAGVVSFVPARRVRRIAVAAALREE